LAPAYHTFMHVRTNDTQRSSGQPGRVVWGRARLRQMRSARSGAARAEGRRKEERVEEAVAGRMRHGRRGCELVERAGGAPQGRVVLRRLGPPGGLTCSRGQGERLLWHEHAVERKATGQPALRSRSASLHCAHDKLACTALTVSQPAHCADLGDESQGWRGTLETARSSRSRSRRRRRRQRKRGRATWPARSDSCPSW